MNLVRRLEATQQVVEGVRYSLPQVPEAEEVAVAYELAHAAIEQFMHNTHNEWFSTIEAGLAKELNSNLLTVDKASGEELYVLGGTS